MLSVQIQDFRVLVSILSAFVAGELLFAIKEVLTGHAEIFEVFLEHVNPQFEIPHKASAFVTAAHALLVSLKMIWNTYLFIQMADYFTRRTDQCH